MRGGTCDDSDLFICRSVFGGVGAFDTENFSDPCERRPPRDHYQKDVLVIRSAQTLNPRVLVFSGPASCRLVVRASVRDR